LSKATFVDCGLLTVEIVDTNTNVSPDSVVFDDGRTVGAFNFASLYTDDVDKRGKYPI